MESLAERNRWWRPHELVILARDFTIGSICKKHDQAIMSGVILGLNVELLIQTIRHRGNYLLGTDFSFHPLQDLELADDYALGQMLFDLKRNLISEVCGLKSYMALVRTDSGKYLCGNPVQFLDEVTSFLGNYEQGLFNGQRVKLASAHNRPVSLLGDSASMSCHGRVVALHVSKLEANTMFDGSGAAIDTTETDPVMCDTAALRLFDGPDTTELARLVHRVAFRKDDSPKCKHERLREAMFTKDPREDTQPLLTLMAFLKVTVRWQDGTVEELDSAELVPFENVDDYDLWPADNVVVAERPNEKGIVQKINPLQRMATVRWKTDNEVLSDKQTEISMYELVVDPELDYDVDDFVVVPSDAHSLTSDDMLDRFGQIVELRTDGMCVVRHGFRSDDEKRNVLHAFSALLKLDHPLQGSDDLDTNDFSDDMEPITPWYDTDGNPVAEDGEWESESQDKSDEDEDALEQASSRATSPTKDIAMYPISETHFAGFEMLDMEPVNHFFADHESHARQPRLTARVLKESKILKTSTPPGILVRAYERRLDLLRVLIFGPFNTPYEQAPLLFDVYLPPDYPASPPKLFFHASGFGRINPNLYEDGKVCLSLLGTWFGDRPGEEWTAESTLLQVFISLQALVLVREPFYNEAGFEALKEAGGDPAPSGMYSERAYLLSRMHVLSLLERSGVVPSSAPPDVTEFTEELRWYYLSECDGLSQVIQRADSLVNEGIKEEEFCISTISKGGRVLLNKSLVPLKQILSTYASFASKAA
jgi:ubiquitin-protein ligase